MRTVRNRPAVAAWALLIGLAAGCNSPVVSGPSLIPLPPAPRPRAVLAIEDPSVIFRPSRGQPGFEAEFRFLLRETGGTSGAMIRHIFLGDDRGGGTSLCTDGLRVPPGGVFDKYYTDEGFASLGYCAPYWGLVPTPTLNHPATVTVTFVDDDGVIGWVHTVVVEK
jgi:hypothetical protein